MCTKSAWLIISLGYTFAINPNFAQELAPVPINIFIYNQDSLTLNEKLENAKRCEKENKIGQALHWYYLVYKTYNNRNDRYLPIFQEIPIKIRNFIRDITYDIIEIYYTKTAINVKVQFKYDNHNINKLVIGYDTPEGPVAFPTDEQGIAIFQIDRDVFREKIKLKYFVCFDLSDNFDNKEFANIKYIDLDLSKYYFINNFLHEIRMTIDTSFCNFLNTRFESKELDSYLNSLRDDQILVVINDDGYKEIYEKFGSDTLRDMLTGHVINEEKIKHSHKMHLCDCCLVENFSPYEKKKIVSILFDSSKTYILNDLNNFLGSYSGIGCIDKIDPKEIDQLILNYKNPNFSLLFEVLPDTIHRNVETGEACENNIFNKIYHDSKKIFLRINKDK